MRRSITAFALGLGLTLAVPGLIATAQAAPAKGKSNKKDSDKAKKDSASKKGDKKNDPGFAL